MKTILMMTLASCALALSSCSSTECMKCKDGTCTLHGKPMSGECAECKDGTCSMHGKMEMKSM